MSNNYFQFKQFLVQQDTTAMKVSTDACIQGAWTPIAEHVKDVLDIGTGTGLLALMLAQRSAHIQIDAVEIDELAASQAAQNIAASPWKDRIRVIHGDMRTVTLPKQYDLIICNPPFFRDSLLGDKNARNIARHSLSFSHGDMLAAISTYLKPGGYASILLPVLEHNRWEKLLQENNMEVCRRLNIRPRIENIINRVIGLCSASCAENVTDELVIYEGQEYTAQATQLLGPFYLKL